MPSSPLRVLTWHVHGSYLNYLTQTPVTWLLPVRPDRADGYGGRGATFTWGDDVVEVPAEEVRDLDVEALRARPSRLRRRARGGPGGGGGQLVGPVRLVGPPRGLSHADGPRVRRGLRNRGRAGPARRAA